MTYPAHNPELPVVAFDFDGVLAANTWPLPHLGEPDSAALDAVRHYAAQGCEIHVLTARPESHFRDIREWLHRFDVGRLVYDVTNKKMAACLYFDDRAVRWPLCG